MPHQNIKDIMTIQDINSNLKYKIHKFYELGIIGLGADCSPYIDMSSFLDFQTTDAKAAHSEILNFINSTEKSIQAYLGCYVPEDIENRKTVNYFVWRREKYIPKDVLENFTKPNQIGEWIFQNQLCRPNWNHVGFLVVPEKPVQQKNTLFDWNNMFQEGKWTAETPSVKKWIENLNIFSNIGRIAIFKNLKGQSVGIHRDSPFAPSKEHTLVIQFNPDRPWFIYDEIKKEKIYVKSRAFIFNSQDLHGVDAETTDEITLRIYGTFQQWVAELYGFKNGYLWNLDYPSAEKIKDIKIYEPDERP